MYKTLVLLPLVFLSTNLIAEETIPNHLIDYQGFKRIVIEQEAAREAGRLSEDDFVEAIASGNYVLLDARSASNFERRHVVNAINLPFTEFDEMSLGKVIPEKDSKILIYCNNNFVENTPSMVTKSVMASLNVNTQASLRAYGYENIFELGPSLSLKTTKLNFEGTEVAQLGY